jgi:hypothetical protein
LLIVDPAARVIRARRYRRGVRAPARRPCRNKAASGNSRNCIANGAVDPTTFAVEDTRRVLLIA